MPEPVPTVKLDPWETLLHHTVPHRQYFFNLEVAYGIATFLWIFIALVALLGPPLTEYDNGVEYVKVEVYPTGQPLMYNVSENLVIGGKLLGQQALIIEATASPAHVDAGQTVTISIHVTDGTKPVQGAKISLNSNRGGSFSHRYGVTDNNGDFRTVFTAPDVATQTQCTITIQASSPPVDISFWSLFLVITVILTGLAYVLSESVIREHKALVYLGNLWIFFLVVALSLIALQIIKLEVESVYQPQWWERLMGVSFGTQGLVTTIMFALIVLIMSSILWRLGGIVPTLYSFPFYVASCTLVLMSTFILLYGTPSSPVVQNGLFVAFSIVIMIYGVFLLVFVQRSGGLRFFITNKRILTEDSFIGKKITEHQYESIQDVTVRQSYIGKKFQFGDIVLTTVSTIRLSSGRRTLVRQKVVIPGVAKPLLVKNTLMALSHQASGRAVPAAPQPSVSVKSSKPEPTILRYEMPEGQVILRTAEPRAKPLEIGHEKMSVESEGGLEKLPKPEQLEFVPPSETVVPGIFEGAEDKEKKPLSIQPEKKDEVSIRTKIEERMDALKSLCEDIAKLELSSSSLFFERKVFIAMVEALSNELKNRELSPQDLIFFETRLDELEQRAMKILDATKKAQKSHRRR